MVAPVISIGTRLLDGNYASLNTNLNTSVPTDNGTSVNITGVSITSGTNYFAEVVFTAPVDCSAVEAVLIAYGGSLRTNAPFSLGLRSGAGNYRVWQNPNATSHTSSLDQAAFLDLSQAPTDSAGTFDATAVDGIRWQVTPNRNDANRNLEFKSAWLSNGTVISEGDGANPVTSAGISSSIVSQLGAASNVGVPSNSLYRYLISPQSVTYDATVSNNELDSNGSIVFSQIVESNNTYSINNQTAVNFTDLRTAATVQNANIIGDSIAFNFNGGLNCDYNNVGLSNAVAVDLSTSRYSGFIQDSVGPITNGDTVNIRAANITNGTTFLWNGTTDYTGTRVDSPAANYNFDFGNAFADGATFDASGITFVSNPVTRKFRLDAAGKTLNLSVGTSGLTAADVEVVAGTLNIVAPVNPISIIGFPTGSTIVLSQAGRQLDLLNNAASPYTYNPQAGELTTYTFKVISAGNNDFITELNTTQATVAQYLGTALSSQQTLDPEQTRFSELMRLDDAFLRVAGTDSSLNLPMWEVPKWQAEWNAALPAATVTTAEIAAWIGYLATAGYGDISINAATGAVA